MSGAKAGVLFAVDADANFIEKVILASFSGVAFLVLAIVGFFVKRSEKKTSESSASPTTSGVVNMPTPFPSQLHDLALSIRAIERGVDQLQTLAQDQMRSDAREGVYDAETRRLIADIASALQAVVTQMDRMQAEGQRYREDRRQDLKRIEDHIQLLRSDFRDVVAKIDKRRSSRP